MYFRISIKVLSATSFIFQVIKHISFSLKEIIRKMEIKMIALRNCFQKSIDIQYWKGRWRNGYSHAVFLRVKHDMSYLERNLAVSFKTEIHTSFDPFILLLYIHQRITCSQGDILKCVHNSIWDHIKNYKQHECKSIGK